MNPLTWIVLATLAGGALSMLAACVIAFTLPERWVPRMVSFAVGAMLGADLLDLLPEAVAAGLSVERAGATVLAGLLLFFVLEKLALWRHQHIPEHGGNAIKPAGPMILLGDAVHNFVDGVLIAAAFLQDVRLGVATTIAVIAHEIPQEVGDFMVLLSAGYSKSRAFMLNLLCSLTAVAGGLLGYFLVQETRALIPYALALAAASFIYIAVADLVPELHHDHNVSSAPSQLILILSGIGAVALSH